MRAEIRKLLEESGSAARCYAKHCGRFLLNLPKLSYDKVIDAVIDLLVFAIASERRLRIAAGRLTRALRRLIEDFAFGAWCGLKLPRMGSGSPSY